MISIGPEPHAYEHFHARFNKLMTFDTIRANDLLESTQYGILYSIAAFIVGGSLNLLFEPFTEKITTGRLAFQVFYEMVLIIIGVYYLRKIVKIVPFLFEVNVAGGKTFRPYLTMEYNGELVISLIFIGVQFRFIRKLDLLANRLYNILFGIKLKRGIAM
jgi:hypothetical protein